jgi:hypothetical protein
VCGGLAVAQSDEPVAPPPAEQTWLESLWNLPVFRWLSSWQTPVDAPQVAIEAAPPPPCWISGLQPIEDQQALAMEDSTEGLSNLNLDGLTPRTSKALARFENLVQARGGNFVLTSAYRPATYQAHLRDVWYKWVYELKDNNDPACGDLKAQVGEEFTRHGLLLSQHPVPVSDHTLGIGFDAAVTLPTVAIGKRRRRVKVSVDRIARLSGVVRPDVRRDPVHFRLIGGRG